MAAAAARVALAVVLIAAAIAKLRRRELVRPQIEMLVPAPIAAPVAVVLPLVELALAALLLGWWGSPVPGVLAGATVLAFTVVLVRALARHVPCPCFGGSSAARPVGPVDVFRNGVLLALAVLATG